MMLWKYNLQELREVSLKNCLKFSANWPNTQIGGEQLNSGVTEVSVPLEQNPELEKTNSACLGVGGVISSVYGNNVQGNNGIRGFEGLGMGGLNSLQNMNLMNAIRTESVAPSLFPGYEDYKGILKTAKIDIHSFAFIAEAQHSQLAQITKRIIIIMIYYHMLRSSQSK
jgi:hypothetical protein